MNGLIALSLSCLLGQTAPSTEASAGTSSGASSGFSSEVPAELTEAQAASEVQAAQLEEMRARLELLQLRSASAQQQAQERLSALEQEQTTRQASLARTEQTRQAGLESLRRGYEWLYTLDGLLVAGQESIGPAVESARLELGDALASAEDTGRQDSARLIETVLGRLGTLEDSVSQRNPDDARRQLLFASGELLSAWRLGLDPTSPPGLNP